MRILDLVTSALQSLRRTRNRSILTMLGIVIGIMSVILVLSIGESAQRYIVGQVASFGSDLLLVANGPKEDASRTTPSPFVKEALEFADYRKLRQQPWVRLITAEILQSDTLTAAGQDNAVQVAGTTPDEVSMFDLHVDTGEFLTQENMDSRARVVALGADIARKSFGQENAVGRTVKINGQGFKVVGVMRPAGTRFFQNVDQQAYIPLTTAMDVYNKKHPFLFSVKTSLVLPEAQRRIEELMRERHNIADPKDDDFHVHTQEDVVRSADQITGILQMLLSSVAAISLLVGGIGIMNIMFVSVTERIREIGLRKAVGAKRGDILGQFLIEAIILTTLGGIIGVVVGTGLTWLAVQVILSFQDGWTFSVSTRGVLFGVIISSVIGVVFGYAPARRAASLLPMDALRKE